MNPTLFTGSSRYSSDFQSLIDRAVSLASLPMVQMQQSRVSGSDEKTALETLNTKITSLKSSIKGIADSFGTSSFSAYNSSPSILTATTSEGVTEGTYTIKVVDIGSYATTSSKASLPTVSDPASQNIDTASEFKLVVDGEEITLNPSAKTLNALVASINSANAGVQATVVNVSPSGTPDYRLSLQSKSLGSVDIELKAGGVDLIETPVGGSQVRYSVNGRVEESVSDTRTVTLSTGLTIDLLKQSTDTVTISVSRSTGSLKTAVESFIKSYNSVIDDLTRHTGSNSGALGGQSIVQSTNTVLRGIGGYAPGNSGLTSLASIGVLTDSSGKLYLDNDEWGKVKNNVSGLAEFFGESGVSGFLKSAENDIKTLQDETTGIITAAIGTTQDQIDRVDDRITEQQERIDVLTRNLQDKFYAADALIAALEQQASYFSNMWTAMRESQASLNG